MLRMKQFSVVLCLLPPALGEAEPGYGYGGYQRAVTVVPSCTTVYDTRVSQVCEQVGETVFSTEVVTSTKTVTDNECNTESRLVKEEQVCDLVTRQVEIKMPTGVVSEQLSSAYSGEGILTITAPREIQAPEGAEFYEAMKAQSQAFVTDDGTSVKKNEKAATSPLLGFCDSHNQLFLLLMFDLPCVLPP